MANKLRNIKPLQQNNKPVVCLRLISINEAAKRIGVTSQCLRYRVKNKLVSYEILNNNLYLRDTVVKNLIKQYVK